MLKKFLTSGSAAATGGSGMALAVAYRGDPNVTIYRWSSDSGFGVKYNNPSVMPGLVDSSGGLDFSPAGDAVALGSPNLDVYRWSSMGFGSRYSTPLTFVAGSGPLKFSPSGTAIAITVGGPTNGGFPRFHVYRWSSETGFGEKYTDPTTGTSYVFPEGIAWSPNEDAIVIGSYVSSTPTNPPKASAYAWSAATGFGTQYTTPNWNLGTATEFRPVFSPNGNVLVMAHSNPYTSSTYNNSSQRTPMAYHWSAAGFGTIYSVPPISNNRGYAAAFNASGTAIAYTSQTAPLIHAFLWSDSTGYVSKYADPTTAPGGTETRGVAFSPTEDAVAVALKSSPYIRVYRWSNAQGFGAPYNDPSVLPTPSVTYGAYAVAFVNM